jgi:hypothetical protein
LFDTFIENIQKPSNCKVLKSNNQLREKHFGFQNHNFEAKAGIGFVRKSLTIGFKKYKSTKTFELISTKRFSKR